ncbi:MAG: ABC transporter permease [Candidatus Cyclobacteriaceae bacterium M3_2C_046]
MRKILFIIEKEFRQIFRNRLMIPIIFVMPVVQLFLLSYAANFEIDNLKIHVVDHDHSATSKRLLGKLNGSSYFVLASQSFNVSSGYEKLEKNLVDVALVIPAQFEANLFQEDQASLQLLVNAINASKAGLANAYLQNIIADFNQEIRLETLNIPKTAIKSSIGIKFRHWFNPYQDYKVFMVPGILVLLVTMISLFLSGINIVREKEIGTIEQLNATTIKKHEFIIGKLMPFWLLALIELSAGLLLGWVIFDVPIQGSLMLVYGFAFIYIITILGIGMFISTLSDRQQQAMFMSWFFMVIFILMSGLFTPIENMPEWAQFLTRFNPIAYFVKFMRMVMLKGSGFADVKDLFIYIGIYAIIINTLAIINYRKTSS